MIFLCAEYTSTQSFIELHEIGPDLEQLVETGECRTTCLSYTVPRTFQACWDTCALLSSRTQVY